MTLSHTSYDSGFRAAYLTACPVCDYEFERNAGQERQSHFHQTECAEALNRYLEERMGWHDE